LGLINLRTGAIESSSEDRIYATEEDGLGTLFCYVNYAPDFPNYIFFYPVGYYDNAIYQTVITAREYFRPKNRDPNGYPTDIERREYKSYRSYGRDWVNGTSSGYPSPLNSVEIEKIEGADLATFIGFEPTPPLRYAW
jgi:hypothetical protein